jgi:hypothetical protein
MDYNTTLSSIIINDTINSSASEDVVPLSKNDPLLHIIAVLGFYVFGVVCLIVGYLKREKAELEEDKMVEDFLMSQPMCGVETKLKASGRFALAALNITNSLVQPERKILYV